jgi:hypothetical protein
MMAARLAVDRPAGRLSRAPIAIPSCWFKAIAIAVAWLGGQRLTIPPHCCAVRRGRPSATTSGTITRFISGVATVVLLVVAQWQAGFRPSAPRLRSTVGLAGRVRPASSRVRAMGPRRSDSTWRSRVSMSTPKPRPLLMRFQCRTWTFGRTLDTHRRIARARALGTERRPRTRESLEQRYSMDRVEQAEGTTWRYHLRDTSGANLRAIRNDPHVEDTTASIDSPRPAAGGRSTFAAAWDRGGAHTTTAWRCFSGCRGCSGGGDGDARGATTRLLDC